MVQKCQVLFCGTYLKGICIMENNVIILAGGQGKRMKSDLPKPMFEVLGLPMLDWAIRACEDAGITDICVVTGFNHEVIEKHLDGKYHTVFQPQRMGTGHAVMMTIDLSLIHI
mgnify:CR=1 FL=1